MFSIFCHFTHLLMSSTDVNVDMNPYTIVIPSILHEEYSWGGVSQGRISRASLVLSCQRRTNIQLGGSKGGRAYIQSTYSGKTYIYIYLFYLLPIGYNDTSVPTPAFHLLGFM